MTSEQIYPILKERYYMEVRKRMGDVEEDAGTNKRLETVSRWMASSRTRRNLLLYGGVGNGKTTMTTAINEMVKAVKKATSDMVNGMTKEERSGLTKDERFRMGSIMNFHYPVMTTAQHITELAKREEPIESYIKAKVLFLDDLGCEPSSVKTYGTEVTPVIDLIYKRYDNLKCLTIITTNLDMEDIKKVYGLRVADRIEEAYDTIAFNTESFRKRKQR